MQVATIMTRARTDFRKVVLRKISIFQNVSNETLKKLDKNTSRTNHARGEAIIMRGDQNNDVYVLLHGHAKVAIFSVSGKVVGFRQINPGDIFGEFSAIDGLARSATVEADKASTTLCINAALFWELMESDRAFLSMVLSHLVNLLRSMTSRVVEFSTLAVKNRIHNELLRMAHAINGPDGEFQVSPAPTHSEIAARISTHREAVSREFSRLKQFGIIERRGKALIVKDRARLERMVHEASGECLIPDSDTE